MQNQKQNTSSLGPITRWKKKITIHSNSSSQSKSSSDMPLKRDEASLLCRTLGKDGYQLAFCSVFEPNLLTVTRNIYVVNSYEKLQRFEKYISTNKRYGHSIYCETYVDKDVYPPLFAMYTTFDAKKETKAITFAIHNVIPRKVISKDNEWICGLFIGDKSIAESFADNHFNDTIVGGIIEMLSNYEIPHEIRDEDKKAITVGIYIKAGTRVVLKSEKLIINELSSQQMKKLEEKKSINSEDQPIMCTLLQGGGFVWIEAEVEVRIHDTNCLTNTPKSLKELIASKGIETSFVPIFQLNEVKDNDWGIQIKPIIEGIYETRRVCIEAPEGWNTSFVVKECNYFNIDLYFIKTIQSGFG